MQQQIKDATMARYDQGKRLARFERTWELPATRARHERTLPLINQAVMGFFSGQTAAVAKGLDEARFSLSELPVLPKQKMVAGFSATLEKRLVEPGAPYRLRFFRAYPIEEPMEGVSVTIYFFSSEDRVEMSSKKPLAELGEVWELTAPRKTGDFRVGVYFHGTDPATLGTWDVQLSVLPDAQKRVAALQEQVARLSGKGVREETLRHWVDLLTKSVRGEGFETEYPLAKLTQQAEELLQKKPPFGEKKHGQFWLRLAGAPVRLLAPLRLVETTPLPLVIALHGVGGSENMFFDTYGAGKLARRCEEYGWFLLTLRNGAGLSALPELLAELGKLYPYDPKRVYLVGHSMGAAMAVQAAQANPKVFAAVAALGGGGAVQSAPETLPPFLVGAGAEDFGKPMAQSLAKALKTQCKIYPDCEHLTVVQDALDDVMRFFEGKK